MNVDQKIDRIRALLLKVEECEQECHELGFHDTAHLVNGVKNGLGWGYARFVEAAGVVGSPPDERGGV